VIERIPKSSVWVNGGHEFVDRHGQALERECVRARIHLWIDLIFGCYQRSAEKDNLLHRFEYADCIDHITDKQIRRQLRTSAEISVAVPSDDSDLHTSADAVLERQVSSVTLIGPEICMDEDGEAFRVIPDG
jgi:hypothetical protein